jgi:hypothetical protein
MAEMGSWGDVEVVKSDVDGWDVRREGESQALSNHPTKEQAEEAARLHGGEGDAVDAREDISSETPADDLNKGMAINVTAVILGVTLLMVVVALIAALTDFGA